ncbi:MAG TPA: DUF2306 domain-containing protein [Chitinophagaceae bacterium]|nr:DUF2306 domain-containing protein [Chitinophagaceae bacterium]
MISKILKILMAALAVFVGFYPFRYFFLVDRNFGLLQLKTEAVLTSPFWNIGFYSHIIPGGIALLIGWIQFSETIRTKRLTWHRTLGKIYVFTALMSSLAGIYIAFYATGGITASLGFMSLGLFWFYSTYKAYSSIRNKNITTHQQMMIYSYAACLAAVTLRIYLPLMSFAFQDFTKAYLLVAWISWLPNLAVAFFIIKRQRLKTATAAEIA